MSNSSQTAPRRVAFLQASHPGEESDPARHRHSHHGRDRRPGRDRPALLPEEHDRDRAGHAALHAARTRRPQHLCARRLLSLPQPDDPVAARRGRALRPLFAGGREHVRPSVPMGLEAQRTGHRARRRQVHRRLACRASGRSAFGRAAVDHAELRLPDDDAARHARARRQRRDQPRGRRSLHRRA